jgi:hypothetical protein
MIEWLIDGLLEIVGEVFPWREMHAIRHDGTDQAQIQTQDLE